MPCYLTSDFVVVALLASVCFDMQLDVAHLQMVVALDGCHCLGISQPFDSANARMRKKNGIK